MTKSRSVSAGSPAGDHTPVSNPTNQPSQPSQSRLTWLWVLVRTTFEEWQRHNAARLAAALAYYATFSLAPLMVITIAVLGLVIGAEAARGHVVGQIETLVGRPSAELIQSMLARMSNNQTNFAVALFGIVTLILGATGVFGEMQSSLNLVWDVSPEPRSTPQAIKTLIINRLMSLGMVFGIGLLLLVSLVISTALAAANKWAFGQAAAAAAVGQVLNFALGLAFTALMFGAIYKVLPDQKIPWRDVVVGAVVTAVLFSIGRFLLSLYLSRSTVTSVYGAAGSLVVVLLWVYYSAQIFFLGAEFTHMYSRWRSSASSPSGAPDATLRLNTKARAPATHDDEHTDAYVGASITSIAHRSGALRAVYPHRHIAAHIPTADPRTCVTPSFERFERLPAGGQWADTPGRLPGRLNQRPVAGPAAGEPSLDSRLKT